MNLFDSDLDGDDLEDDDSSTIEWKELISAFNASVERSAHLEPQNSQTAFHASKQMNMVAFNSSFLSNFIYPNFVATLDHQKPFFGGFLGFRGDARVFVTELSSPADTLANLYPIVIQVLSREYGCFMKKKISWIDQHQFFCRDKRNIFVWFQRGLGWSRVIFRQFDHFGFEISVKKKMIMRISSRQILDAPLKPDPVAH